MKIATTPHAEFKITLSADQAKDLASLLGAVGGLHADANDRTFEPLFRLLRDTDGVGDDPKRIKGVELYDAVPA